MTALQRALFVLLITMTAAASPRKITSHAPIAGVEFTPLDVGTPPDRISGDVIALIPGRQVQLFDYIHQLTGVIPLDGGPVQSMPLAKTAEGETVHVRSAIMGAENILYAMLELEGSSFTRRSAVGRMKSPPSGTFEIFPAPTQGACDNAAHPCDIELGPGNVSLYYTATSHAKIGKIASDASITELPVQNSSTGGGPSTLRQLTSGPGGFLYATGGLNDRIYRMSESGQTVDFRLDPTNMFDFMPHGITATDDAVYITARDANEIIRMTQNGTFTRHPIPNPNSDPLMIVTGEDDNIYWIGAADKTLNQLVVGTGAIYTSPIPNADTPIQLIAVKDSTPGFTELIINGYNNAFDFTPQRVRIDKSVQPPGPRLEVHIHNSFPISGGSTNEYVVGEVVSHGVTVFNEGTTATQGPWQVTVTLPEGFTPLGNPNPAADFTYSGVTDGKIVLRPNLLKEVLVPEEKAEVFLQLSTSKEGVLWNRATVTGGGSPAHSTEFKVTLHAERACIPRFEDIILQMLGR